MRTHRVERLAPGPTARLVPALLSTNGGRRLLRGRHIAEPRGLGAALTLADKPGEHGCLQLAIASKPHALCSPYAKATGGSLAPAEHAG
jgi:hypothetical protein